MKILLLFFMTGYHVCCLDRTGSGNVQQDRYIRKNGGYASLEYAKGRRIIEQLNYVTYIK